MNRERFVDLVKQYSNDTLFRSGLNTDHRAYIELMEAGEETIPWALERLQDSVGHDRDESMDLDNDPWLLLNLIVEMTYGKCLVGHDLTKLAGNLEELRKACLEWASSEMFPSRKTL